MRKVCVLRLGHRPFRDKRVTTHVGLAARAFGAAGMYLAAEDPGLTESIRDVVARWGGSFFIEDGVSWKRCVRDWKEKGGTVVHLTMYGLPMTEVVGEIRKREDLLIVVGAEKVPGEIYGLADYNVSVTGQPHSEVSGTAVFLDHLFEGMELGLTYPDAELRIYPSSDGKRTGP
ncbi:MAG TPA: tRNA (cytidine(56)-2'-O)-methyltransferase [Methanomicrobiales archaeon]|nr:tRNA (cytidine(56)-2'-O)-methyltransferase [Methanomicrobiales archaeon]